MGQEESGHTLKWQNRQLLGRLSCLPGQDWLDHPEYATGQSIVSLTCFEESAFTQHRHGPR